MSTLIKFLDKGSKIDAATPDLSTTPIRVIFESFLVNEIPVIIFFFRDIFSFL